VKPGSEQYIKKWFSPSESHICLPDNNFANMEMQKQGEVLAEMRLTPPDEGIYLKIDSHTE
jgi:hypothetical protein